jgi:hypothetical protein
LGVGRLGLDGLILFNFENISFCPNCRKRSRVTEVLDQVHWQGLIKTIKELIFFGMLLFDGGEGIGNWDLGVGFHWHEWGFLYLYKLIQL